MNEIWKPIPDTDYAVSNTGKVASMKKGWRVLRPVAHSQGYAKVTICVNGAHKTRYIHRLVADAFLCVRPTPKHEVNHCNGIKDDNRDLNLEWVTPSENTRHSVDALGNLGPRGEKQGNAKLTKAKVYQIRARRAAGELLRTIAADFGVSKNCAWQISRGNSWAWLE